MGEGCIGKMGVASWEEFEGLRELEKFTAMRSAEPIWVERMSFFKMLTPRSYFTFFSRTNGSLICNLFRLFSRDREVS
jgi:hypothetical protein